MSLSPVVAAFIAGHETRTLPAAKWAYAAGPVRDLVAAAAPATKTDAHLLLAAATKLLALPSRWDGVSAPNWQVLLTDEAINRAINAATGPDGSLKARRTLLRRLAVAAGVRRPAVKRPGGRKTRRPDPLLAAAARYGATVVGLAALYQHRRSRPVTEGALRAATGAGKGNVSGSFVGTVWVPSAARPLAEAQDQPAKGETMSSHAAKADRTPVKRVSRRAIKAHHDATAAALAAARGETKPASQPPLLPAAIAKVVGEYRPATRYAAAWELNRDVAVRLVAGTRPVSVRRAQTACSNIARFVAWFASASGRNPATPIDLAELLPHGIADAFIAAAAGPGVKGTSLATLRAEVRRALGSLNPAGQPRKLAAATVSAPYTSDEMAALRHLAATQATAALTANACFIIGLGAGAGITAADLRHLTGESIGTHDGVLSVTVTHGARPRTVPIREQYVELVKLGVAKHRQCGKKPSDLLIGRNPGRNNVITLALARARGFTGQYHVTGPRLRNTWLVAVMNARIPLADVLASAGIISAKPLIDLLAYCEPCPPDEVAELLAAVTDSGTKW